MTVNQQQVHLSLTCPVLMGPIPPDQATDRVSNEQASEPDSDSEPSDTEQKTKVLCHQPQEGVPRVPKAYLLCTMDRSIYTAQ